MALHIACVRISTDLINKNMIWIACILEILWVIGIISYIKDEMSRNFWRPYITLMTIANIITAIVHLG